MPAASPLAPPGDVEPYERRLARDLSFAVAEFDAFFGPDLAPFATLRRLAQRLDDLQIDYRVGGDLACFVYGHRKVTPDIEVCLKADWRSTAESDLLRHGYRRGSDGQTIYDPATDVPITLRPVRDWAAGVTIDGVTYLSLEALITLKVASWMSAKARAKDAGDVQELIRTHGLTAEYADQLHPYVREAFREQCEGVAEDDRSGG